MNIRSDFDYLVYAALIERSMLLATNNYDNKQRDSKPPIQSYHKKIIVCQKAQSNSTDIMTVKKKCGRHPIFRIRSCDWCKTHVSSVWRGTKQKNHFCNPCWLSHSKGRDIEETKVRVRKPRGEWHAQKKEN